jgi:CheY-like chemotaxis protein
MDKIAVVDDDPDIVEVFSQMLSVFGFHPCPFTNPVEALENISKEKPLPSLILLDLMMIPITGLQFLEERRKNEILKTIPIFIISAWDLPDDDRKRFGSEIASVLRKPITPKDLVEKIRAELDMRGKRSSGSDIK